MEYLLSILLIGCVLQHAFASVAYEFEYDLNGNFLGCTENGEKYGKGQPMPSKACMNCVCGKKGEKECVPFLCETGLPCVNPKINEKTCCEYCPNGHNCWLDGNLFSACDYMEVETSDPYCRKRCVCPPPEMYMFRGVKTEAICSEMCA